jgi:hypothetical protein
MELSPIGLAKAFCRIDRETVRAIFKERERSLPMEGFFFILKVFIGFLHKMTKRVKECKFLSAKYING